MTFSRYGNLIAEGDLRYTEGVDLVCYCTGKLHPPMPTTPSSLITLGLIGLGTVGGGVYKVLQYNPFIKWASIAVQDIDKQRPIPNLDHALLTTDPWLVVNNPNTQVVIEVIGGIEPALSLIKTALASGKHVVTANKELIAKHGVELFTLAEHHNVRLLFEGAVAGGIPIILPLKLSLAANRILEIAGILNGTTNYILSQMTNGGKEYSDALAEAQAKGFAEADPTSDVEGFDTAYKISILSGIAYKQSVDPVQISREGISGITAVDIANAKALGFVIKLIGLSRQADDGAVDVRVHPMLVPMTHPLASIHNEYNAVFVKGDAVGEVMFMGKGAGELPTASAVTADVLAIVNDMVKGNDPIPAMALQLEGQAKLLPMSETKSRYYVRLNTLDLPGVIGNLGKACGEFGVSLESVIQQANPDGRRTASIVLVTHHINDKQLRGALERIASQETTDSVGCVLRVL
jgi:homoserine dehydrogenase